MPKKREQVGCQHLFLAAAILSAGPYGMSNFAKLLKAGNSYSFEARA